jgi:hypothetical protein
MAKKLSIIDQLNALCDQVIVDTTKAKETYQMSEDKLIEYVGSFAHTLAQKYCTTLKKYEDIKGKPGMYLCVQSTESACGAGQYLSLYLHGYTNGLCDRNHPELSRVDHVDLSLTWDANCKDELLSITGSSYHAYSTRWLARGNSRFNEKLAVLVRYIKSGQFEKDFVKTVTSLCEERVNKNTELKNTAKNNNNI